MNQFMNLINGLKLKLKSSNGFPLQFMSSINKSLQFAWFEFKQQNRHLFLRHFHLPQQQKKMLTTSRKRINTIEVTQLLNEIKQTTKDNSIYNKLNSYDHIIKKYKIDPLDQTALEIYEYLIQEQTLSSLPMNSRSKVHMQSFKFSRNQIQLLQEQQQDIIETTQINIKDVEDPETHNQKLFSFAKNPHHKNQSKQIFQHELKPKQLFNTPLMKDIKTLKEKQKSKSDNKVSKNPIFYINEHMSNHFYQNHLQLQSENRKQSVKTIAHLSNSQSQSNLKVKEIVFNSQKTKQFHEQEQITAKYLLNLHLKQRYFKEFLTYVQKDIIKLKQIQKTKKIKYFSCMRLLKNSFKGLLSNLLRQRENSRKAFEFFVIKSQYLIEQYFVQWKQYAFLSEQAKQRYEQIQEKSKKLSSLVFLNSLKDNLAQTIQTKERLKQEKMIISMKTNLFYKTLFFTNLLCKFNKITCEKDKTKQINQFLKANQSKLLLKTLNSFFNQENIKEAQKINACILKMKGRTLIDALRYEQNFNEVYWKNKNNSKKLIFLNYLFTAAKAIFQRMGYQYSWMPVLQQNIYATDQKLSKVLTNDIKLKAFKRLTLYAQSQKQKKNKIKVMFMDNFLKCLAFSSYLDCLKKAQALKIQQVQQNLYINNGVRLIELLDHREEKRIDGMEDKLKRSLREKKCRQFFIYLESYQRSKEFYSEKIHQFKQRSMKRFVQKVWVGFKRVLKGEAINKKLVSQYLNLKGKIIAQKCFEALKENIFEQKLMRKKQGNLKKLIKLRSFNEFHTKLKENYSYRPQQKEQIQRIFTSLYQERRKQQFFNIWMLMIRQKDLKHEIQHQLTTNYQSHLTKTYLFIIYKSQMFQCIQIRHTQNQRESQRITKLKSRKSTLKKYYLCWSQGNQRKHLFRQLRDVGLGKKKITKAQRVMHFESQSIIPKSYKPIIVQNQLAEYYSSFDKKKT